MEINNFVKCEDMSMSMSMSGGGSYEEIDSDSSSSGNSGATTTTFIFVSNKVKKTRSRKTKEHRNELEEFFSVNSFPDAIDKEIIAYQLDMSVEQVITWYKHKREQLKKLKIMDYKQKNSKKFTKTTKELHFYFSKSPYPSKESIEYFASVYRTSFEKVNKWFQSKRYSLRQSHSFFDPNNQPQQTNIQQQQPYSNFINQQQHQKQQQQPHFNFINNQNQIQINNNDININNNLIQIQNNNNVINKFDINFINN